MTVPQRLFAQNDTALGPIRELATPLLGKNLASRIRMSSTGILYISATLPRAFLSWLVDEFFVLVVSAIVAVTIYSFSRASDPVKPAVFTGIIMLLVFPWFYGWFFRNGRALGGWITDTRLVRIKDGQKIGWTKAGWAMSVRVFFLPFLILTLLESFDFQPVRTSIDIKATEQLRQAGFTAVNSVLIEQKPDHKI